LPSSLPFASLPFPFFASSFSLPSLPRFFEGVSFFALCFFEGVFDFFSSAAS
jgi:hypothetical protein